MSVGRRCLFAGPALALALPCFVYAEGGYPGWRLIEKRFIKEVNAECVYLEHEKTGAKVLKIAAADPNKTFCVMFRTIPDSDSGTPHILEHSVLNGSKMFPVKSPFDTLCKGGSLATFLNAMTSSDKTVYPAASMNQKDYFNLMRVYMDAVLNPLIYERPGIFMQEGWHYEADSKDAPLTVKGVVYNEMKGSYSNPMSLLHISALRALYPDNSYRLSSGGDPDAIPNLTGGAFLDFHRRWYHPSNAFVFLYGDAPLDQELALLDKEFLSKHSKKDIKVENPAQRPHTDTKDIVLSYPAPAGSSPEGHSYLALAWLAGSEFDTKLSMELDILADALVKRESAPLRAALKKAGIGQDAQAFRFGSPAQTGLMILVKNASSADADKFKTVVMDTLGETARKGFDKEFVSGILDREEFSLRENDEARKGMKYLWKTADIWLGTGDPFKGLEYEADLAAVKEDVKNGALERIIKTMLLDSPPAARITLGAEPGLEAKQSAALAAKLADMKKKLSQAELDNIVAQTQKLLEIQRTPDSPEALASVPMLDVRDLSANAPWDDCGKRYIQDVSTLHCDKFTGGITYMRFFFDTRSLPPELLQHAALLRDILGKLGTGKHSFGELENALNRTTGGFYCAVNSYLERYDDSRLKPKFCAATKTLASNTGKTLELMREILLGSDYSDKARLKELVSRIHSSLDGQIKSDGVRWAMRRLESYYSSKGVFEEKINGLDYFFFIRDLNENFDARADELCKNLALAAKYLFTKENLTNAAVCGKEEFKTFETALGSFIPAFPDTQNLRHNWAFRLERKNEALLAASKVQSVFKGGDYKKAGYIWTGKMKVLSQILSTDFLWNKIRETGGAYGGFSRAGQSGTMFFGSYRDPNLKETLDCFDSVPEWLEKLKLSDKEMSRYIIGTIAGADMPLSPSAEGDRAFTRYFEMVTHGDIQRDRDEVMSATSEDIAAFAPLVSAVLAQDYLCVYGDAQKLQAAKGLFKNMLSLMPPAAAEKK